jgi:photosystem II stability/assembly factor-like uncharacterized protein
VKAKLPINIMTVVFSAVMAATLVFGDENTWSTNGPECCRVMTTAIDPSNNQIIYIGTVENGIYKTFDAGENWVHLDSDILPLNLRRIAIHPMGIDTVFAATISGLYRSNDAGETWTGVDIPGGSGFEVIDIEFHPTQPNIMFVNGPWELGINYRSMDGGRNWEAMEMEPAAIEDMRLIQSMIILFISRLRLVPTENWRLEAWITEKHGLIFIVT